MSTKLIPDPKAPKDSTDYIYGERMKPFEERMNFFLNEKVEVKKDNVKEEDKATVDGLENVITRFAQYGKISLPYVEDSKPVVDGLEAAGTTKRIIDSLIQFVKDAVDWIMNLVNNRIARVDRREYLLGIHRKRNGVAGSEVQYPAGIRRIAQPIRISTDPNWVPTVLKDVNDFYNNTINAYKALTKNIDLVTQSNFNITDAVKDTLSAVKREMKLGSEDGSYVTDILPGNRRFIIEEVNDGNVDQIRLYFQQSPTDAKLKSKTFDPNSFVIDDTLKVVRTTIKNIRSNQSTISQLYRSFEKTVVVFQNKPDLRLTTEQKNYLNWLVRFNKKLMTTTVQYVLTCLDTGLDFVNSGVSK